MTSHFSNRFAFSSHQLCDAERKYRWSILQCEWLAGNGIRNCSFSGQYAACTDWVRGHWVSMWRKDSTSAGTHCPSNSETCEVFMNRRREICFMTLMWMQKKAPLSDLLYIYKHTLAPFTLPFACRDPAPTLRILLCESFRCGEGGNVAPALIRPSR